MEGLMVLLSPVIAFYFLGTYYGVIPAILLHSTIYRTVCLVGIYFLCQAPQHLAILGLLVYK
jgi:hypothetical protein